MKQLCYVSESTANQQPRLEDLTAILSEARHFNYKHDITGVLYYSNGQFFQCLEGESLVLEQLINKLEKDTRHKNIEVFEIKEILTRRFKTWSMKYVGRHSLIKQFFVNLGYPHFDPKKLNQDQIDDLLNLLVKVDHVDLIG